MGSAKASYSSDLRNARASLKSVREERDALRATLNSAQAEVDDLKQVLEVVRRDRDRLQKVVCEARVDVDNPRAGPVRVVPAPGETMAVVRPGVDTSRWWEELNARTRTYRRAADQQVVEANVQVDHLTEKCEKLEAELRIGRRLRGSAVQAMRRLQDRASELGAQVETLKRELATRGPRGECDTIRLRLEHAHDELAELREKLTGEIAKSVDASAEIAKLRGERETLIGLFTDHKDRADSAERKHQAAARAGAEADSYAKSVEARNARLGRENARLSAELAELRKGRPDDA